MPLTHHTPLRSNMESCCRHAANGRSTRKGIFTRTQIVRRVKGQRKQTEKLSEIRERMFPTRTHQRIANVRKTGAGYHVVGLGVVDAPNNAALKELLRNNKFTGIRRGGLTFKL